MQPVFSDQPRAAGKRPVRVRPKAVKAVKVASPEPAPSPTPKQPQTAAGRDLAERAARRPSRAAESPDTNGSTDPVITAELQRRIDKVSELSDEELLAAAGLEPVFSTTEAAQFFDRSNQWLYWGLRKRVFTKKDGTPIDPERIKGADADEEEEKDSPHDGRRRFTLPILKDILHSSYQRGNITDDELKIILRRIKIAELGGDWREREGWRFISGRWVHPSRCEKVNGKWVKIKSSDE